MLPAFRNLTWSQTEHLYFFFLAGSFDQIEFYLPSSNANQRNNTIFRWFVRWSRDTEINIFDELDISTVYSNEQMESQSDDF